MTSIRKILENDCKSAAIAVVDAQGELLAFLRTDGCLLPSIDIAINKVFTAARQRKEIWKIGESSGEKNYPMTNFGDLRYNDWDGGVPIVQAGQIIGAVGVSSLPEEADMAMTRLEAEFVRQEAVFSTQ